MAKYYLTHIIKLPDGYAEFEPIPDPNNEDFYDNESDILEKFFLEHKPHWILGESKLPSSVKDITGLLHNEPWKIIAQRNERGIVYYGIRIRNERQV